MTRFFTEPCFMTAGAAMALLQKAQEGEPVAAEMASVKRLREGLKPAIKTHGSGLASLEVSGVLMRKPGLYELAFGEAEDSAALLDLFNSAVGNSEIKGILLNIDSPGGFLTGGPELADAIKNSRKPIVAWTGGSMASLAYWIGSQAGAVIATRSARVGSIGAYTAVYDYSKLYENAGVKVEVIKNAEAKFKAAGIPGTSLSEAQRQQLQSSIQTSFDEFKAQVSSARPNVKANAMQGQVFGGSEARGVGLIDAIGSQDYALAVLRSMVRNT